VKIKIEKKATDSPGSFNVDIRVKGTLEEIRKINWNDLI